MIPPAAHLNTRRSRIPIFGPIFRPEAPYPPTAKTPITDVLSTRDTVPRRPQPRPCHGSATQTPAQAGAPAVTARVGDHRDPRGFVRERGRSVPLARLAKD